jgi:hypothetical protein
VSTPFLQDPRFSIEMDRGFAETYQYVKEYWAALLFLLVGLHRRQRVFGAWALVFAYLLIDDAFMLHERAGAVLGGHLPVPPDFPLQAEHAGEAAMLAALSALSLALLALTWPADAGARRACARLLRLVALLALFGVGADAVHAMASPGTWQQGALGVVEDGGEMVVLSAIVALAVRLRGGPPEGAGGPVTGYL